MSDEMREEETQSAAEQQPQTAQESERPSAAAADAPGHPPADRQSPSGGEAPAGGQAQPDAESPAAAEPAPAVPRSDKPHARSIKIGSERERHPKPKAKPQKKPKGDEEAAARRAEQSRAIPKTALPNLRQEMPDEMQREFEQALGGAGLDDLLQGSAPEIARELEEGSEQAARVLAIRDESVFVDLGGRDQGVLSRKQFPEDPQIGAEVTVRVLGFHAEDGLYEVSLPGAALDSADWSSLAEGSIVEAVVTGHNKGGLEVEVNKIRGFIPISQAALYRVENLEQFVGQRLTCVATEVHPDKRNLVLSHRAVLERQRAERREQLLEELQVGQTREGVVRKLEKFGAFVDLGGIDGLIHIGQLSWDHIRHPSEVLEVGQQVRVRIEKVDPASGKIGLGYRDLFESPWVKAAENYPFGTTVRGTVSRVADFGAFVKLEPGVEGLVHVSEIAHHRINRPSDYLKQGQEVEVQVLSVDAEQQRISLSIKALQARDEPPAKTGREDEVAEESSQPRRSQRPESLKGGMDRPSGGEQFGLKW